MKLTRPEVTAAEKEPLPFTPEQQAAIRQSAGRLQTHLQMIPFFFDKDGLSTEMARNVLHMSESELAALGKLLGVATESAATIEQRYGDIRRANLRIRELEGLLGQAQPVEALLPALAGLDRQVRDWWRLEGFGFVSGVEFGGYGVKLLLSCHFHGTRAPQGAPKDGTRQERFAWWLADLQARGFELMEDEGERGLRDCPETRHALRELFGRRFPFAKVSQFVSHERSRGSQLESVELYVYDLAQIRALPVPVPDAEKVEP